MAEQNTEPKIQMGNSPLETAIAEIVLNGETVEMQRSANNSVKLFRNKRRFVGEYQLPKTDK